MSDWKCEIFCYITFGVFILIMIISFISFVIIIYQLHTNRIRLAKERKEMVELEHRIALTKRMAANLLQHTKERPMKAKRKPKSASVPIASQHLQMTPKSVTKPKTVGNLQTKDVTTKNDVKSKTKGSSDEVELKSKIKELVKVRATSSTDLKVMEEGKLKDEPKSSLIQDNNDEEVTTQMIAEVTIMAAPDDEKEKEVTRADDDEISKVDLTSLGTEVIEVRKPSRLGLMNAKRVEGPEHRGRRKS